MRIFTAFPLEDVARRDLYSGYERVRKDLDAVRWVAEENLHITLIFFGEMKPRELDELLEALESEPSGPDSSGSSPGGPTGDEAGLSRPSRFRVEYRGIECFPPKGKPKVIYSRITAGTAECVEVWRRLIGRLASAGMSGVGGSQKTGSPGGGAVKPYIPHITLGRIKAKGYYPRPDNYGEISGGFEVSSFGVFESKLTPDGPVYRLVQNFSLGDKTV